LPLVVGSFAAPALNEKRAMSWTETPEVGPDLTDAATQLARFMATPRVRHMKEAKNALRYSNAAKARQLLLGFEGLRVLRGSMLASTLMQILRCVPA
jgi:hypothetical protein